jgi:hypothetical protein
MSIPTSKATKHEYQIESSLQEDTVYRKCNRFIRPSQRPAKNMCKIQPP